MGDVESTSGRGGTTDSLLFWPQARRDAAFRELYELFPSARIAKGTQPCALTAGRPLTASEVPGVDAWVAGYVDRYHIAGVMVLQSGRVRLQRYGLGFGPDQRWVSFSMAKSVTSVLAGAALQEGYIHSLEDTVANYVPELHDSAYAAVTVRQLLTMTSGVRWYEDYADPESDVARKEFVARVPGEPKVVSYVRRLPRQWPPGTHWNYNTAETDLLGVVVQRAARRSLAAYLSQKIWQPYGMAADAYWIKDECDGSNTGGSGISATLADYARFGQFVLDGCRLSGGPLVSMEWRDAALRTQQYVDEEHRSRGYHGYGYQWWVNADRSFFAVGIFGQMIHLDPARQLVIVQLASWPHANAGELNAARAGLVSRISGALDAEK